MRNIQSLLHEVNVVNVRNEAVIEATGGRFNMFSILGVNHYENTHSSIIAEILNPFGSHGLREKFLQSFLSLTIPEHFTFDCKNANVETEKHLGYLGRVDIFIEQKDKRKAIIIENKIYASDQSEQLKRYNEYGIKNYSKDNYLILYLTLDGAEASYNSCNGVEYSIISYSKNIIKWMEDCAKISLHYPLVRETINQYINHLKQLTNQDMDTNNQKDVVEILSRKENARTIASILNNEAAWKQEIIEKYLKPALLKLASEKGLLFGDEDMHRLDAKDSGFSFYKKEWGRFRIFFYSDNQGYRNFYYGISHAEGIAVKRTQSQLDCFNQQPSLVWPFGAKFLDYRDWTNDIFADFTKEDESEFIRYISKVLDDLLSEMKYKEIKLIDCDMDV